MVKDDSKAGSSRLKSAKDDGSRRKAGLDFRDLLYRCRSSLQFQLDQLVYDKSSEVSSKAEESVEVDQELEQLTNMTRIPLRLEKFMLWTLLACFDCFLHYFTVMPLRIISDIFQIRKNGKWLSRTHTERFMVFLIVIASIVLSKMDTSKAYHRIKRQSSVKLYMLFGVLEMADKMLASMGQSLFTVILSGKFFRQPRFRQFLLTVISLVYLICHGYVMVLQTVALNVAVNSYSNAFLTLLLSMQFAEIKASLLKRTDKEGLFQLAIADVVERSQITFLLIIIALRNIFANSKLQSSLIPRSWTLHATSSVILGVLCGPMFSVIGSELLVDWVKHAYVTKFNRIRPQIYGKFLVIMCTDYTTGLKKFCDRLGLPIQALVVLFIVMIRPTLSQMLEFNSFMNAAIAVFRCALGFVCLIMIKMLLRSLLVVWSKSILAGEQLSTAVTEEEYVPGMLSAGSGKIDRNARSIIHGGSKQSPDYRRARDTPALKLPGSRAAASETRSDRLPPTLNELRSNKDAKNPRSLERVTRYNMVSKRIW
ncbi:hypothetical protein HG536_0D02260 [Torulaspora globosa]|uniref:Uncharacterized protein n=1 Tax=Torulaspora globosa TaxID=48254 RepID=A0A7G3ZGR8_9SACH|nr:uncharacterized protein HG536_0D02260 [Torulaspora globosa]QLL32704.1 hypothetical protein HG536_0D02260 [Torulaspora globosa]